MRSKNQAPESKYEKTTKVLESDILTYENRLKERNINVEIMLL